MTPQIDRTDKISAVKKISLGTATASFKHVCRPIYKASVTSADLRAQWTIG